MQDARQPLGYRPGDDLAMTPQRVRLPRHDDNLVRVAGRRNPERVTLPVHHQYRGAA